MQTLTVAKALVLDGHGRLLLLKRSKTDPRRPGAGIPGGYVNQAKRLQLESYEKCLKKRVLNLRFKSKPSIYRYQSLPGIERISSAIYGST